MWPLPHLNIEIDSNFSNIKSTIFIFYSILFNYDLRILKSWGVGLNVPLLWLNNCSNNKEHPSCLFVGALHSISFYHQHRTWLHIWIYWNLRVIVKIHLHYKSSFDPIDIFTSTNFRKLIQFRLVHFQKTICSNFYLSLPCCTSRSTHHHVLYKVHHRLWRLVLQLGLSFYVC